MLSYTSKDITTVFEKSNIAWCWIIPMFTTEGPWGEAGTPAHRAPQAKKSQWRDIHWLVAVVREYVYRTIQYLPCDQYSSGSMRIVAERSASVRIQILSPALVVYADRMRNPCSTASSFSRLSSSGTSPQSPLTWLGSDKARSEQARFLIAPV